MNHTDLQRFRAQLNDIRLNMGGIKEQATQLNALLDEDRLIPGEIADKLIHALQDYQEKSALLQKTGKEISLTLTDSLVQIEDELKTAEEKALNAAETALLLDYFRLTSEAEDVKEKLETSKQKLRSRLIKNDNAAAEEYAPYKLAVRVVDDPTRDLSKSEFKALMDGLGFEIAWALKEDRTSLFMDAEGKLPPPVLEIPEEPVNAVEEASAQEEESPAAQPVEAEVSDPSPIEEEAPVAGEELEESEDMPEETAVSEDQQAFDDQMEDTEGESEPEEELDWSDFHGYADNIHIDYTDTPAGSLGASKFLNAARSKPMMTMGMGMIAHQKLIPVASSGETTLNWNCVPSDLAQYLVKQGVAMPVVITVDGETSNYLMMTSKGWAAYKKADIKKFLKKDETFIPEFLHMTPDQYTPANIKRLLMLRDYYMEQDYTAKSIYGVFPEREEKPIYAYVVTEHHDESPITIPVVFERGSEQRYFDKILSAVNNWQHEAGIYIICCDESDMEFMTNNLLTSVDVGMMDQVYFCIAGHPNDYYDWDGEQVDPTAPRGEDEDEPSLDEVKGDLEAAYEELHPADEENTAEPVEENPITDEPESEKPNTVKPKPENPDTAVTNTDAPTTVNENTTAISSEVGTELTAKEREHIDACVDEMLASSKIYCASAYMAAAANSFPEYESRYSCMAYAVNDPLIKPKYTSQSIINAFFSRSEPVPDSWVIAAVLRNFFLDQIQYDYDMQNLYATVKEIDLYSGNPRLKNVTRMLMDFKLKHWRGLDSYADYRVAGAASYEANLRELQKEAKLLYEAYVEGVTRENAKNERFLETKKLIFARDGDLAEMLKYVSEMRKDEAKLIKEYLQDTFLKDEAEFSFSNLDGDKLDAIADDAWSVAQDRLFYKRNNVKFVGELRRNLLMRMRECIEVLCRFVELCAASAIDEKDTAAIDYKRIRKELLNDVDKALKELSVQDNMGVREKADRRLISFALMEIREKVDGTYQEEKRKFFYLPFLRNEHVLMTENFMPQIMDVEGLPEMSALACIERHFRSPQMSLCAFAEEILHGEDDYGTMKMIQQYLVNQEDEDPGYLEDLKERAKNGHDYAYKSFVQSREDFKEYLELAQSYGQINSTVEDKKETMLQTADIWYEFAKETKNYGFFRKIIDAFKAKIREDAKTRAIDLEKNLDAYKAANKDWAEGGLVKEAIDKIEECIRFQNYSAAEDMLNRLQANDLEEHIPYFTKDYLADFLNEYNDIAKLARSTGSFNISLPSNTKEGKSGAQLLDHWPKGLGVKPEAIQELLRDLGFSDPQVTQLKQISRMDNFQVVLKKPINGRKANYKHPISIFGSEAEENDFRVVCAYGRTQPEALIDSFKLIGNAKHTIMFLDYALTLPERRTLARLAKEEYIGKTFVVIDRVVIAYLAKHYSMLAMNRMLMAIVIPFAYYQPYVAKSADVMPPEIFMGRKTELEKIEAPDGVNIVYGGRQLGKSALLRMAQKDINWNENGDRAVLIEIKGQNYKQAAKTIAAELLDQFVLDTEIPDSKADDWNEIGRAIKKVLRNGNQHGKIPYLLLLLDEADAFIESCAEINYQPFDVLKDIQSVGPGRFKFVVAGLRNVVRFNRDAALSNNSVLTHLSSLTVTPFKSNDARELLQVPLHYLGFRFPNDSKTDMLISNIFGTTNYFPGLLQLYCTKLIEAMQRDYAGYNESETPPYYVREEHIKKVLADKTLEEQIREKFEITLKVGDDDYYYQIAVLVAFHYHEEKTQSGCSPAKLLSIAKDYGLPKISALTVEEVHALMEELRELNVLQLVGNGNYRFTRLSFCEMMGLPKDIDDKIMSFAMEE